MLGRYFYFESNGSSANAGNHLAEVQIIDTEGVNRALGRGLLRYSAINGSASSTSRVTDGDTSYSSYFDFGEGKQHVVIDLGDIYDISHINVWRYYSDGRAYKGVFIKVSIDDVDYKTVFSSDEDGMYAETAAGKKIDLSSNKPERILSIEAETGILGGNAVVANRASYSGNIVVDGVDGPNSSLTLDFIVPYTGEYIVRMFFTHSGNRQFSYTLNGNTYELTAVGTGYYSIASMDFQVYFAAGTNTVVFRGVSGHAPMFDRFDVYSLMQPESVPNGEAVFVIEQAKRIASAVNSSIKWTEHTPEGTSVKVFAKLSDCEYLECVNGENIPCINEGADLTNTNLEIKIVLSTEDVSVSPAVLDLRIEIQDDVGNKIIILDMGKGNTTNIQGSVGEVTVSYAGGTLIGRGGMVPNFSMPFLPVGLEYKGHQHEIEHIEVSSISATFTPMRIYYKERNGPDHLSAEITAQVTLIAVDDL